MTTTTTEQEKQTIEKHEEKDFADFNPDQPLEIEEKYRLTLDTEKPPEKTIEDKGMPRAFFITMIVAIFMLIGFGIWQIIKPKPPQTAVQPSPSPSPTEQNTTTPDYRAKLALQNQQYEMDKLKQPKTQEKPQEPPKKTVIPPKTVRQPPPKTHRTVSQPVQPASPVVKIQSPQANPIRPFVPPTQTIKTTDKVDPFKRWQELANLGQTIGQLTNPSPSTPISLNQTPSYPSNSSKEKSSKAQIKSSQTKPLTTMDQPSETLITSSKLPTITLKKSDNTTSIYPANSINELSPGAQGIINRTQSEFNVKPPSQSIPFGTIAKGTVSLPLIWDTATQNQQGFERFTITLTQDLLTSNGSIAFSAGTVLIAEAMQVNPSHHLVQATVIAIVTRDTSGTINQQILAPGVMIVQGINGQPLIAQTYNDPNNDVFWQDVFISTLNGLGRIGKVLTEPEQTSIYSNNGAGGISTTTTVQSRDPEIWAAVLDGFFNPMAERIGERSSAQIKQRLQQPTVAILPQNTPVEIVVKGLIEIQ